MIFVVQISWKKCFGCSHKESSWRDKCNRCDICHPKGSWKYETPKEWCLLCNFLWKSALVDHIKNVHEEKKCDRCDICHEKAHEKMKPLKCDICCTT